MAKFSLIKKNEPLLISRYFKTELRFVFLTLEARSCQTKFQNEGSLKPEHYFYQKKKKILIAV